MKLAFCAVGILVSAVFLAGNTVVSATQFTVGGSTGWSVPSNNNPVFNQWAERMRFQIGDSLLFVYPSSTDSVYQVTKADYDSCNTASPINKYTDGHTLFKFDQSGPYFFISGNRDNCLKNEKLHIVVLAQRSKLPATPAPAPATDASSPPAPAPVKTPSPAPSGAGSATPPASSSPPSPPPSESGATPPEAPSAEAPMPHKNGANGVVAGTGLLGLASLLLAAFPF